MSRGWRVYHGDGELREGTTIELSAAEAHHVRRVLRLRPGEQVDVFDGRGGEWSGVLAAGSAPEVRVHLERRLEPRAEPGMPVALYQGACRPERLEWLVQKATEIGVARICPLRSARGAELPPDARRLGRLQRIAVEACKQCGRAVVPRIETADLLPPVGTGQLGLLLDPDPSHPSLGQALASARPREVCIAVGGEGGFTDTEIESARAARWRASTLGPRILRTETAGLVAAAIVLHHWGDLGRGLG